MSIYYLIASLPTLSLDEPAPLTAAGFVDACRGQLASPDAAAAEALVAGTPAAHPFVVAWHDKDTQLRNAVARRRAARHGTDATRWLHPAAGCDVWLETRVDEAFQETDPLDREKALDRLRWQAVETLQGPDPMTLSALFAYAVKLAIVLRWSAYDEQAGRDTLAQLTDLPFEVDV